MSTWKKTAVPRVGQSGEGGDVMDAVERRSPRPSSAFVDLLRRHDRLLRLVAWQVLGDRAHGVQRRDACSSVSSARR
jgi:hypothetical protein